MASTKRQEQARAYYQANKEKVQARTRAWRLANPDRMRASQRRRREAKPEEVKAYHREHYRKNKAKASQQARARKLAKYGLTQDEYQDILDAQGGVCAVCTVGWRSARMVVDHDHRTGRVRGILCHRCNAGLGLFDDDPVRLEWAMEYLSSSSSGATSTTSSELSSLPSTPSGSPTPRSTALST
jgi:hypothetical protein